MKLNSGSFIVRFFKDQSAQMLPIMALMVIAFMSIAAFSVSIGSTYVQQHELQAATNAAALAGAQALPNATAAINAAKYGSSSGENNSNSYLPGVTMATGYPKLECLTTLVNLGVACVAPTNANAIQVKQQITVPILFGGLFGGKATTTLTATATASARGSGSAVAPYNVAIIVDGTGSMSNTDSDSLCSSTRMSCALQGVRVLLQALSPCNISSHPAARSPPVPTAAATWSAPWTGSPSSVFLTCPPLERLELLWLQRHQPHTRALHLPHRRRHHIHPIEQLYLRARGFLQRLQDLRHRGYLEPRPQSQLRQQLGKG